MADDTGSQCPLDKAIQSSLDRHDGHHEVLIRHRHLPDGVAAVLCCERGLDHLLALVDDDKPGAHQHLQALVDEVILLGGALAVLA